MDNEQVEARIKKVFIQELGLAENQYTPDAIITDDLSADCLTIRTSFIKTLQQAYSWPSRRHGHVQSNYPKRKHADRH